MGQQSLKPGIDAYWVGLRNMPVSEVAVAHRLFDAMCSAVIWPNGLASIEEADLLTGESVRGGLDLVRPAEAQPETPK